MLTSLENLNDFDVGGDYVTNILYISIAIALFARATKPSTNVWRTAASVCLLGLALSSRAVYAVTILPLLAFGIRNGSTKRTILMFCGVLLAATCATLPVYLPHPIAGLAIHLSQSADKVRFLPPYLPVSLLAFTAFLVSSFGLFRRRISLPEVFGLSGAAAFILIFPPMSFVVRHEGGWTAPLTADMEYLAPAAIFLSLWALSLWERDSLADLRSIA